MAEDPKAEVVREICSISSAFVDCSHLRRSPRKPAFVDWYLILRVDDDAGTEVIRRRYRQLALQLHPDKNKHPKAEVAFKIVSKAYECLVDKARRRAFNSDRRKNFCKECHEKLQSNSHNIHHDEVEEQRGYNTAEQAKSYRVLHAKKEARNRFREECRVIEGCLRANGSSGEFPLFDPFDCLLFPDYPHLRDRVLEKSQNHGYFNAAGGVGSHWGTRGGRCESPIYQIRSENRAGRSKVPHFSC